MSVANLTHPRSKAVTGVVALVVIVAAAVFVTTMVHALFYAPEDGSAFPSLFASPPVASMPSDPTRLIIPSLSINANVQYVGKNAEGNMRAPTNFTDAAWYKDGTIPGKLGSAVIDGHVDNGLGLAGVFKHLGDLKEGDDVYVVTKDGSKLHFVVSKTETYPYTDAPAGEIFTADDKARLNLITCAGTWLRGGQTYNERLVVYTTYVDTVAS
jgi:LPXTG-site transpeptidase (sortase) family protein